MNNLLIVGCGDIALRTIPLLQGRYRLYALVRDPAKSSRLRVLGVTPILGDLDDRSSLAKIAGLADIVVHFAPPVSSRKSPLRPPFAKWGISGTDAKKYSPPFAKGGQGGFEIDIRTRNLLSTLSTRLLPVRLIYISTSGVYGDCQGDIVSETRPVNPQNSRAQLRVSAENQIRTWAKHNQVNASILRVPGIYSAGRLPLERLRAGSPVLVAEQDSYSNHIHADDLARIVVAALRRARPNRVYHAVDDDEMKMGDYFDVIADAFNLPRPPRLSQTDVQRAVSPIMWSFMNESRRLTNVRMKRELKVALRYPTVDEALTSSALNPSP